jgi:hypothetical protein
MGRFDCLVVAQDRLMRADGDCTLRQLLCTRVENSKRFICALHRYASAEESLASDFVLVSGVLFRGGILEHEVVVSLRDAHV